MPAFAQTILASAALTLALVGCSGSDGGPAGLESARAVVDAHVDRSRAYDLQGDCELRHPDFIAEMAGVDGRDPEGYCEWATASLRADATSDERARTQAIFTDPTITAGEATEDRATFSLESADGTYVEDIVVIRRDGSWFLESAQGDEHDHDHDH